MIVGESKLALVEPATPFEDQQRVLDDTVARLVAEGREVGMLLVTHHHPDHVGDVERLRQLHGVPLYAHAKTAAKLSMTIDHELEDDDIVELGDGVKLRAVHTPGHAPGHLVFHELRSGIAHAGDMVAGEGTILIDRSDDGDMSQYLDSLRRLGELGTKALIPAHGPVLEDPQAIVDHYISHRLAREEKVVAAIEKGAVTLDEIVAIAYEDTPRMLWPLAARALDAHLHKLHGDGVVVREGDGYRPAPAPA